MFRGLRLRLTLLYLAAGVGLTALVGGGAYGLVRFYFAQTTDLALQHTMAGQFRLAGAPLPGELEAAVEEWYAARTPASYAVSSGWGSGETEEDRAGSASTYGELRADEGAFDSELAAIFVLPLDSQGSLVSSPGTAVAPFSPVAPAAAAANTQGYDWRTVREANGDRVRLLTYRLSGGSGPALMQIGRSLADQDRLLNQLLVGYLLLSLPSLALVGAASWWLAGRSLVPAQRAWDRQEAFVANASHELRTPLTLMRASAEVAQRGLGEKDERHALLADIVAEIDHMSRLVEDQLLLARLDAGRLHLNLETVSLEELLGEIHRQFLRVAGPRGVVVELGEAPGRVQADPTRLRQVLLILLDNALAHTPAGGRISLRTAARGETIEISVADTGRGIAPEDRAHVFERFYRGRQEAGDSAPGSGLGLAIARGLVEAQRGKIRLESSPGQGTRIGLILPSATS